ncbi:MAG: hypothetical protein ACRCW2_08245 [Cellulosilyticaceae bacterium]
MSKKYRIKHLKLSKVFMGCVALGIVPAAMQLLFMLIGILMSGDMLQSIGASLVYCLLMPITFGIGGVVIAAGYNWISPKVGQFEIELEEVE